MRHGRCAPDGEEKRRVRRKRGGVCAARGATAACPSWSARPPVAHAPPEARCRLLPLWRLRQSGCGDGLYRLWREPTGARLLRPAHGGLCGAVERGLDFAEVGFLSHGSRMLLLGRNCLPDYPKHTIHQRWVCSGRQGASGSCVLPRLVKVTAIVKAECLPNLVQQWFAMSWHVLRPPFLDV